LSAPAEAASPAVKRPCIAVAVSGGRDSTALWHATARAARATGLQVVALHVHHGLQPDADHWVSHLQRQARRWAAGGLPVSLVWRRLAGAPATGDSIEAWARRERYAALADMARAGGADTVLLGHHRRDQAETFLLQALRGAGPTGLAAMPREVSRDGIVWARPWLEQPHRAIDAYVQRHRLSFVQDMSNDDRSLARNRLRHEVWPVLAASFDHASTSLAASARRAQEAAECLRELAALDARQALTGRDRLEVPAWLVLSPARRANLLRAWLSQQADAGVPETLVQRLLHELAGAVAGAAWPWPGGELRLHAGQLQIGPAGTSQPAPVEALRIDLSRAGRHLVPTWGGAFEVHRVDRGGLAPDRLRRCELRVRRGAEQFQRSPRSLPRSLKKQFQSAGVPGWQRGGPLVYADGQLLFVPGLGIDARAQAEGGQPMLGLRWLPDNTPPV
jgi:tRNA(Ile)-lysidine synthase